VAHTKGEKDRPVVRMDRGGEASSEKKSVVENDPWPSRMRTGRSWFRSRSGGWPGPSQKNRVRRKRRKGKEASQRKKVSA